MLWVKARACSRSGNCVEVSAHDHAILLGDSKDPDGPVLRFTVPEWLAFLDGVKQGEFEVETLRRT
jgi:hypothetical protein